MREKIHCSACETKLPDWCKVGEWVWETCQKYAKIIEIDDENVTFNPVDGLGKCMCPISKVKEILKQARVRPWTFEEAPLMLKARRKSKQTEYNVFTLYPSISGAFRDCRQEIIGSFEVSRDWEQLDGSPCGVLEHLNDNGEWVE